VNVNRRNYYRILHVQPEAPAQIITASYRTLMSKLKVHPDLGGDTDAAALINEAYAVLSDSAKRARYDEQRRKISGGRGRATAVCEPAPPADTAVHAECPFCSAAAPASIKPSTRCPRCSSPLASPPIRTTHHKEFVGRRTVPRMPRADSATLFCDWQSAGRPVELRDMSLAGVALVTDLPLERGQVIRIVGSFFDVLALVVSVRREGLRRVVHATLRTAHFKRPTGVLLSTKA
jgi:hypothetical protein